MNSNNLSDKLERVERSLAIYTLKTQEEIIEINLNIPFENLKRIISPKDDDLLLYDCYVLDEKQLFEIAKEIKAEIKPNFKLYYYVLICRGIYDW